MALKEIIKQNTVEPAKKGTKELTPKVTTPLEQKILDQLLEDPAHKMNALLYAKDLKDTEQKEIEEILEAVPGNIDKILRKMANDGLNKVITIIGDMSLHAKEYGYVLQTLSELFSANIKKNIAYLQEQQGNLKKTAK